MKNEKNENKRKKKKKKKELLKYEKSILGDS
jgi:hypothetical protein